MLRKYHQLKLEKISEKSCSPNQKASDSPISRSRMNPTSVAASYIQFHRIEQDSSESISKKQQIKEVRSEKEQTIETLQQEIMEKQMRVNKLESCFSERSKQVSQQYYDENGLVRRLSRICVLFAAHSPMGRKETLTLILACSRGTGEGGNARQCYKMILYWILKWIRIVFTLVTTGLKGKIQQ